MHIATNHSILFDTRLEMLPMVLVILPKALEVYCISCNTAVELLVSLDKLGGYRGKEKCESMRIHLQSL